VTPAPHALTTARLLLRPALPGDLAALLSMRDAAAAPDPTRETRVRALLEENAAQFTTLGFGAWLVLDGARPVGFVGLRPRETANEPELYYGLAPDCRGRGYATESGAAVIERLFAAPAVTGVWAVTDPPNVSSWRVLERLGLQLEREGEFDGKPSRLYRLRRPAGDALQAGRSSAG
jgi:RimJ/RimL family protein N-acetyltransferase